ncbi:hypothetical protein SB48_HM08orf02972 [Heyndrickxia coagulans]|uniref:Uncharacterized protein n=1 Tax=Heyndrickxia coagulans TaxID=1398 RepID=A0AAN0T4E8_HEYCO|nr:hypothetical protein SB48_HM08orf02972 [Heyndrickxia coagulans]
MPLLKTAHRFFRNPGPAFTVENAKRMPLSHCFPVSAFHAEMAKRAGLKKINFRLPVCYFLHEYANYCMLIFASRYFSNL